MQSEPACVHDENIVMVGSIGSCVSDCGTVVIRRNKLCSGRTCLHEHMDLFSVLSSRQPFTSHLMEENSAHLLLQGHVTHAQHLERIRERRIGVIFVINNGYKFLVSEH